MNPINPMFLLLLLLPRPGMAYQQYAPESSAKFEAACVPLAQIVADDRFPGADAKAVCGCTRYRAGLVNVEPKALLSAAQRLAGDPRKGFGDSRIDTALMLCFREGDEGLKKDFLIDKRWQEAQRALQSAAATRYRWSASVQSPNEGNKQRAIAPGLGLGIQIGKVACTLGPARTRLNYSSGRAEAQTLRDFRCSGGRVESRPSGQKGHSAVCSGASSTTQFIVRSAKDGVQLGAVQVICERAGR